MSVATDEKRIEEYVVRFYDAVSGWLHSERRVSGVKGSEVVAKALADSAEAGEDVSRHRVAVTNAANGHGVGALDNQATKAQIAAQLEQLQKQLAALQDEDPPEDSVKTPAPRFNAGEFNAPTDQRYDPRHSQVQAGIPVAPASAPRPNAGAVTQDDIAAYQPE